MSKPKIITAREFIFTALEIDVPTQMDVIKINKNILTYSLNGDIYKLKRSTNNPRWKEVEAGDTITVTGSLYTTKADIVCGRLSLGRISPAALATETADEGGSFLFNENQLKALSMVDEAMKSDGKHIIGIFGEGGTGKSVVINEIARRYENVAVKTAMTSVAAGNIDGVTIHSHLSMVQKYNDNASNYKDWTQFVSTQMVGSGDTICIVDEISMAGASMLDKIVDNQKFKILVLVGDSYQLPPVNDERVLLEASNRLQSVVLTEQMRNEEGIYKFISDFRATRETGIDINVKDYIDGTNIKAIDMSDLKDTFANDEAGSKLIVAFKNEDVDNIIDNVIMKTTGKFRLSGGITQAIGRVNDKGKEIITSNKVAYNGQIIEIDKIFNRWDSAMSAYEKNPLYDPKSTFYTKWNIDEFGIDEDKIIKCSLVDVNSPFVKLFTGSYKEMEEIEKEYFKEWRKAKNEYGNNDAETIKSKKRHSEFKNNIVHVREPYCTTIHKSQGQTVDSIYILFDEHILANKSLFYVAISRAKKNITFVYPGDISW